MVQEYLDSLKNREPEKPHRGRPRKPIWEYTDATMSNILKFEKNYDDIKSIFSGKSESISDEEWTRVKDMISEIYPEFAKAKRISRYRLIDQVHESQRIGYINNIINDMPKTFPDNVVNLLMLHCKYLISETMR